MHHIESDCKYILNKIIIKSVIIIVIVISNSAGKTVAKYQYDTWRTRQKQKQAMK